MDSRGQGFEDLFSKDLISAFNILSISAMSFISVSNALFTLFFMNNLKRLNLQF